MQPSNLRLKLVLAAVFLAASGIGRVGSAQAEDTEAVYRKTQSKYETILRPEPLDFKVAARVPAGSEVRVIKKISIADGPAKVNWYLVDSQGQSGWMSGLDFEDWESERSYSMSYDSPLESSKPLMGADF